MLTDLCDFTVMLVDVGFQTSNKTFVGVGDVVECWWCRKTNMCWRKTTQIEPIEVVFSTAGFVRCWLLLLDVGDLLDST